MIEYVKDVMSAKYVLVKLPDPDNKDNILTLKCLQAKNSSSSPISIYRLVNSVVMNFPSNKKLSKEEIDKKIGKGDGDVNVDECIKRLSYEFDGNQYAFNEIVMPIKLEGMRLGTSHVKNAIVPSKSHVGSKVGPTKSSVPSDSEPEDFAQSDRNKIEKPQRQKRKVEEDTESKSKKPRSTPAMRKQEELIRELEKLRGRDPYDILVEELEPLIKVGAYMF